MDNPNQKPDEVEPEELVREDDAIIARVFKGSLIAIVTLAILSAIVIYVLNLPDPPALEQKTDIIAPVAPDKIRTQIPHVQFTDIAQEAGIDFERYNGAQGDKLLPETMGGGVAFMDFDADDAPDLFFVNATSWPWDEPLANENLPTCRLYKNNGNGTFTDITSGSGLDIPLYGMGVACADYDGDGDVDIYVTCVGENKLFENLGNGRFQERGLDAGVSGDDNEWSTAAAWCDLDNDGWLDLYVANYVKWSREIDYQVNFTVDGTHRAYGPPTDFQGSFPRLYKNNGDGTFTDVSESSGVQVRNSATGVPVAKSLGVAPVNINSNGYMDLVIANDTVPNFLFVNQGDMTFKEMGALAGIAYDPAGNTRGAMGIDTGFHRNDQALGICIGNFANEMTALYVSQGDPYPFADEAIAEGIGPASRQPLKFGIFFFDYDLDGWQDLLSVNGHLDEDITRLQESQEYRQPAQLFWNNQGDGFLVATENEITGDLFKPLVGRGSAYADMDGDGDLDVVFTQAHGAPLLLRNDQGLDHHWLRLKLMGKGGNQHGIGAQVKVHAGGQVQARWVMPTRSYLSQSEVTLTFGLGQADQVETIEVTWPDGKSQTLRPEGKINQLLTIEAL